MLGHGEHGVKEVSTTFGGSRVVSRAIKTLASAKTTMAARPPLWREPAPPAAVNVAPLLYPLPSLTATGTAAMAPVAGTVDAALGAGRSRSGSVNSVGPPPAAARPAVTGLSPADFRARLTQLLEQSPALDAAKAVLRRQLIEQLTHGGAFAQAGMRRPPADPTVLRLITDYLRAHTLPFTAAILKNEAGATAPLLGDDVCCEAWAMTEIVTLANASCVSWCFRLSSRCRH